MSLDCVSRGVIRNILSGAVNSPHDIADNTFIVQVASLKALTSTDGGLPRYRVVFSDGDSNIVGIITTDSASLFANQEVIQNSLVRISEFTVNRGTTV